MAFVRQNKKINGPRSDNRSLTFYLTCRTAVITFLLGGAAVFYINGATQKHTILPLFVLIAISYLAALVSAIALKYVGQSKVFTQIQIFWDLIFITALILLSGGVESVFSFAYLLIIVSTSFLLNRRMTILAAACATILFGGILDLQYLGYLSSINLYRSLPDGQFFSVIFIHSVAFFLTAGLSGTLAERWQRSEAQLEKKNIDYADLEKMNRTILSHISSGLMLVGPKGRVRSFNRAAEEITGLDLIDIYDYDASLIFPGFADALSTRTIPVRRSECSFVTATGDKMILGFATTPALGNQGEFLGTLVTFQDLTQLKKIEEELQLADRLAAVGRLAAGMAHEIRNPLTSISGSVQMLMEGHSVKDEDKSLMSIVVKEADRLSLLLTDFLNFARPKLPVKCVVEVAPILGELKDMLSSDRRFNNIELELAFEPTKVRALLDRDLFFQILWDLSVNAMEAMEGKGILKLSVSIGHGDKPCVTIEDSGPGIVDGIEDKIFEPFFSTKDKGTGLGLASVYSVMDLHGGSVSVSNSSLGGALFCLCFDGEGVLGEE